MAPSSNALILNSVDVSVCTRAEKAWAIGNEFAACFQSEHGPAKKKAPIPAAEASEKIWMTLRAVSSRKRIPLKEGSNVFHQRRSARTTAGILRFMDFAAVRGYAATKVQIYRIYTLPSWVTVAQKARKPASDSANSSVIVDWLSNFCNPPCFIKLLYRESGDHLNSVNFYP